MPKIYDAHESTYIVKDENGNVKSIAPCYAEEEDDLVKAARAYEMQKQRELDEELEKQLKSEKEAKSELEI